MKLGAQVWPQYTDWQSLQDIGEVIERLGYDSLWTWDHLYAVVGDPRGPTFEGYLTLAGWGHRTARIRLGLMVGANTFRNPALVVKMVTTLDHLSCGRMSLGVGGAWFESEHTAFGLDFGATVGERLDRLDEAVELMRALLPGGPASARGPAYAATNVINNPAPLQERLPILIGGSGESKTLATVARYADAWNTGGSPEEVKRKDEILRRWCDRVGREASEIERTLHGGCPIIRDTPAEARRELEARARHHRLREWRLSPGLVGPAELIAERWAPYLELGFNHIYADCPAPFDHETLERLAHEVKPMLEHRRSS